MTAHLRYLCWSHNSDLCCHTAAVTLLQVFEQINRPNLRASYLSDLTLRDDTASGSNEHWVRYLQSGEALALDWQAAYSPRGHMLTLQDLTVSMYMRGDTYRLALAGRSLSAQLNSQAFSTMHAAQQRG